MSTEECIVTPGSVDRQGYRKQQVTVLGKKLYHRHVIAWVEANGRLPGQGMCILHSCDSPPCENPEHLREGTNAENVADRVARGRQRGKEVRDACMRGHRYTAGSFTVVTRTKGRYIGRTWRRCDVCRKDRNKST